MAEHHTAGSEKQDLRSHNLTLPEAMDMAQNESLWSMWLTYGATQS